MRTNIEQTHLRLVHSASHDSSSPLESDPQEMGGYLRRLFLPHSKETLWLRMDTCHCGGVSLFYVRIVPLEDLQEHKPYYKISHTLAEEIVLSKHVRYNRLHGLFRISPVRVVINGIFALQKKLLIRDSNLRASEELKKFFHEAFGV